MNDTFLLWIYDNSESLGGILLERLFITKLGNAKIQYIGNKLRLDMRLFCKEDSDTVNKASTNFPIILPSSNFGLLSYYLTARGKKIVVPREIYIMWNKELLVLSTVLVAAQRIKYVDINDTVFVLG